MAANLALALQTAMVSYTMALETPRCGHEFQLLERAKRKDGTPESIYKSAALRMVVETSTRPASDEKGNLNGACASATDR